MPAVARRSPLLLPAADKNNFPLPPLHRFNHNVALLLMMRIVSGLHTSLWSGTVLASYLYVLMGSNAYAGYVEAAMGVANLVFALPAGYFADRFSRSKVIAVGGWCVPVAAGLTCTAVIIGVQRKEAVEALHSVDMPGGGTPALRDNLQLPFWLFVAALATWGFVQAVQNGAAQALFADSVLPGERSRYYMYSFVVFLVASTLGPVVSIVMFIVHGNDWELTSLRNVFLAGMIVSLPNWVIMSAFSDKKMLDELATADTPSAEQTSTAESSPRACAEGATVSDAGCVEEGAARPRPPPHTRSFFHPTHSHERYAWAVRYLMFASSTLLGVGSGMTVKFFPLFFKNNCQMSPVSVQVVYAILPLAMAIASSASTRLSRRIGRVQMVLLARVTGILLLCALAFLADFWLVESARGKPVPTGKVLVTVGLFLVRTALMNSVQPLNSSIMMDFTPRRSRARWQSMTSIVRFGWCGSAALGGVLADRFGYSFTFLITAGIQMMGAFLQLLLLPLVPVKEGPNILGGSEPSSFVREAGGRSIPGGEGLEPLDAARVRPDVHLAEGREEHLIRRSDSSCD